MPEAQPRGNITVGGFEFYKRYDEVHFEYRTIRNLVPESSTIPNKEG